MPSKYQYFKFKELIVFIINRKYIKKAMIICLIQYFEADFLWKVSLKILKTLTDVTVVLFFCMNYSKHFTVTFYLLTPSQQKSSAFFFY